MSHIQYSIKVEDSCSFSDSDSTGDESSMHSLDSHSESLESDSEDSSYEEHPIEYDVYMMYKQRLISLSFSELSEVVIEIMRDRQS